MNALTLVHNFVNNEQEELYSNFKKIMELKIADKKLPIENTCIHGIFEKENDLNIDEGLNYQVLEILKESVRQKSNISVTLKDGEQNILDSSYSQNILYAFDRLNESNQRTLINNLFSTKTNFKSSIDFCSKIQKG
jgi:hypothetical protein